MQNAAPNDRPTASSISTSFITRLHRYRSLLLRRWWIPLLTTCIGVFVSAWMSYQTPPQFMCGSKMMVAGKLSIQQGAIYSEEMQNFYGTQIQLMQSAEVRRSAEGLL